LENDREKSDVRIKIEVVTGCILNINFKDIINWAGFYLYFT
jgi:hypothetical protein